MDETQELDEVQKLKGKIAVLELKVWGLINVLKSYQTGNLAKLAGQLLVEGHSWETQKTFDLEVVAQQEALANGISRIG